MPPQILKASQLQFLKALVYGPWGRGKTRFLETAQQDPRTSPSILLDFDGGVESIVGSSIDIAKIRSWRDYNEIYEYLNRESHGYKSVCIDSATETHIYALFSILDEAVVKGTRKNRDRFEIGDYGDALNQMRRLVRSFRDLDLHIIFSALDKDDLDPAIGKIKKPALFGAFQDEMPAMMGVVGYLGQYPPSQEQVRQRGGDLSPIRTLLLQNSPQFFTKARLPLGVEAPDEIEEPTVTKLLDALGFK